VYEEGEGRRRGEKKTGCLVGLVPPVPLSEHISVGLKEKNRDQKEGRRGEKKGKREETVADPAIALCSPRSPGSQKPEGEEKRKRNREGFFFEKSITTIKVIKKRAGKQRSSTTLFFPLLLLPLHYLFCRDGVPGKDRKKRKKGGERSFQGDPGPRILIYLHRGVDGARTAKRGGEKKKKGKRELGSPRPPILLPKAT